MRGCYPKDDLVDTLAKKELIKEVFNSQLPRLIEEIGRKVDSSYHRSPSNQEWTHAPRARREETPPTLSEEEVDRIADLLLGSDQGAFEHAITTHRAHGVPIDYIVLNLIPEIARKLGKHWENDSLSFVEVSTGTSRLERTIYKLDYLFQANQLERQQDKSIFISTCPGSQHTLGALIFGNYFIFSGWQVCRAHKASIESMVKELTSSSYQALAISVSTYEELEQLPNLINLLREKSCNPGIVILTGGSLYNKEPSAFDHIQADIKAFSPEESVQKLEQHLKEISAKI